MLRKAIQIEPPPLRRGQKACTCCSGPTGPKSSKLDICLPCYDANAGRRTDPSIYMIRGIRGGAWKMVKFSRTHTMCPLCHPKRLQRHPEPVAAEFGAPP